MGAPFTKIVRMRCNNAAFEAWSGPGAGSPYDASDGERDAPASSVCAFAPRSEDALSVKRIDLVSVISGNI
jgi:hypothetical protein